MIRITSPSRLHLTLIDMNASWGRVDGGAGISLESPNIIISAEKSDETRVIGDSVLKERMEAAVKKVLPEGEYVRIFIEEDMFAHVGIGSGTQASLSAAVAVNELYDLRMSVRELAVAVGRGGTSGIGVASFESGGFIVDGGHRFSEKGSFSPSSASSADPAPVLFRHDFPEWYIILALPDTQGAHDEREADIFRKVCPIPIKEVQEVSHMILMKMMPAIVENDIEAFGHAVNHIQSLGFKKCEVELQHQAVRDVMTLMQESGAYGAGMSSFGPVVYGVVDNQKAATCIMEDVQDYLDTTIGGRVMVTKANNKGADIRRA
ncbi:beta-ribofuranosylaminobenzene 5'-phosphate synthase [Methanolobus halotolerans]|uniref:Beta-ribofuranosylaminobenzene 5'-phosphate synthase n=1 Tax=Methanolobus halotolerans TaxID=2052935 RepID=A0A4E0PZQ9_9EURY|nr:beta-ribofuranosylaminobenzene 5'-phosphate synthase [Methanolobus halotolerans]TGC11142.1 beta-ribofuranosylaminobenzene 5'-phosphate synthase [Methanolobus halotolerans]